MPSGYPGSGVYAGRKRSAHEPARRSGALSKAEQNIIEALFLDQPSSDSALTLARQTDRLARVLDDRPPQ